MYVITKRLTDRKVLLRNTLGESLVASYSDAFERPEVLIFKSDTEGTITDWIEVCGEKHMSDTPVFEAIIETIDTFNNGTLTAY